MDELSPGTSSGPHDPPGLFCGRFELMREEPANTGVQVFGPTLAVLDTKTGEPARACILDAALLPTAEARAAFVRALAALGALDDSSLVPQVFVGEDGDRVVVCYDPLQGAFALRDMDDGPGSADLSNELQRLAHQLARALATLHAHGRVHGMLAAEAVFVGPRGPAAFQHGFAPLCARAELERRWAGLDPSLLAPELRRGGAFTPAADAYAWAVALTEFATGLRGAEALRAAEPAGLPAGLWALFAACLVDDPAVRPRDGAELVRRLEALAHPGGDAVEAPQVSLSPVSEALSLSTGLSGHAPGDSGSAELSATNLEELFTPSAPVRRPPTLPPAAPIASAAPPVPASAPSASSSDPAPAYPSDWASRSEGGRSGSGLRRVHVLTEDAIVRPGRRSGDAPGEPSDGDLDSSPSASRDLVEAPTPTPTPAATAPVPPAPTSAKPVESAMARAPASAIAARRSDRSFWFVIAALLLAVVLAWAFT